MPLLHSPFQSTPRHLAGAAPRLYVSRRQGLRRRVTPARSSIVTTVPRVASRTSRNVSAEGDFAGVIKPAAEGMRGGQASLSVAGVSCAMSLDFEWGTALTVQ